MSLAPAQISSQLQLFKASGRMMRNSPVVSQWPWTSGIPLTAGRLDDEVEKLHRDDIVGILVIFMDTIQVHIFLLVNMANTDNA